VDPRNNLEKWRNRAKRFPLTAAKGLRNVHPRKSARAGGAAGDVSGQQTLGAIAAGHRSRQGGAALFTSDSPRILIARMSAVGDTILTLPVACALRAHFPNAYLGWAVEKGAAAVLQGHACLDELIVLPRGWFVKPHGIADARRRLQRGGFQIAVDCQSITKTAMACWLSGAEHRIGCRGKYGCELSPYFNNDLIEPASTHLTDRSLELLAPLGIRQPCVDWQFPIDAASQQRMTDAVRSLGLCNGYAVINPGATWDSKLWEMDRFAAVAQHLGVRHGLRTLVVWGGNRERNWATEIVDGAAGHAVLAPPSSLMELAALIRGGSIFISSDTGPLHMAVAVGTPSIGLYGATRPADCGPYGLPHTAIQVRHHAGSRKERRHADNHCMRLITSEMVCARADELLQRSARGTERQHAA
jgi:heptosyltransferase-1